MPPELLVELTEWQSISANALTIFPYDETEEQKTERQASGLTFLLSVDTIGDEEPYIIVNAPRDAIYPER